MRNKVGFVAAATAFGLTLTGLSGLTTTERAFAGSSPPLIAFDDDASGVYEFTPGVNQPSLVVPGGVFPAFSPSGMELAYELEHAAHTGDPNAVNTIEVAERNGSHPHSILKGPISWDGSTKDDVEYPLTWSPKGSEIAYGCDGSTDSTEQAGRVAQLCVVDVDTGKHHLVTDSTNSHELVENGGTNQRLSWTPDGKHIIATVLGETIDCFAGEPSEGQCRVPEIGSIDVATGKVDLLTRYDSDTNRSSTDGQLSPDGKKIVYFQSADPNTCAGLADTGIAVMDSNGGGGHIVYSDYPDCRNSHNISAPAASLTWSPNGKDILFISYGSAPDNYRLKAYEIPEDGKGDPKNLTEDNYNVYDPSWTPVLTTCTVPNLKHKTLKQANKELAKASCRLGKISGPKSHRSKRRIVSQSPKAKKDEPAGTKVKVKLG